MATLETPEPTSILVSGATGYVGGPCPIPRLLDDKHRIVCLVRSGSKLDRPFADSVTVVNGSAESSDDVARAAEGCRVAFYLIHSLGRDDFADHDRRMAEAFRIGCERAGVERIVYLGGLGRADDDLSPHLESRQEVGRVLGAGSVAVTEIRAAIIIGSGSASFEMLRSLAETLPVMVTPRWVQETRCQPVAIRDVSTRLQRSVGRNDPGHQILELGGPDQLTYVEMMQGYAAVAGLRRRLVIGLPVLTPSLSAHWVTFVTPLPANLARQLVDRPQRCHRHRAVGHRGARGRSNRLPPRRPGHPADGLRSRHPNPLDRVVDDPAARGDSESGGSGVGQWLSSRRHPAGYDIGRPGSAVPGHQRYRR